MSIPHRRFSLEIIVAGQVVRRLPGLVCRSTAPDDRPWRINLFDEQHTQLAFPHLTFDWMPEDYEEIRDHLWAYPQFIHDRREILRVVPYIDERKHEQPISPHIRVG